MMIEFSEKGMAVKERWEEDQKQKLLEAAKNKDPKKDKINKKEDSSEEETYEHVRDYWDESSEEEHIESIEPVESIMIEELD